MKNDRRILTATLLMLAVFIVDCYSPIGIAIYFLYLIPFFLARRGRYFFIFPAMGSVLIVASYFLSPPGGMPTRAAINRSLGIFMCWSAYLLLRALRRAEEELRQTLAGLENRVADRTKELAAANAELSLEITERQTVEESLRVSEGKFRQLFEAIADGIAITDLNGYIVDCNSGYCSMTGYPREELEKMRYQDLTPSRWTEMEAAMVTDIIHEGRSKEYEKEYRRKDGSVFPVSVRRGMMPDGGRDQKMWAIVRDISDRRQAEESLLRSEQRFAAFMFHLPAAAWMKDLDSRYVYLNAETARILSKPLSELQDKTDAELLPPETAQIFVAEDKRVVAEGGSLKSIQVLREADGIDHHFVVYKFAVPAPDAGASYIGGMAFDISEQIAMEERIKALNMSLAERAAQLEEANSELEAFNYTVAHDLRKPLTVINGYCQIMLELCGKQLEEECRGYLQETHQATLRMGELITALMEFSRIGHAEPKREMVDLSRLAEEVAAELKQAEPERRVTFRIASQLWVSADFGLLRVLLDNLLGNAWKYSSMKEEAIIEVGTTATDGKDAYFVRDNGRGFPMSEAEVIFTPFKRLSGGAVSTGFGIGLATVRRIVNRHGGEIWAIAEPMKGATFYFTLG